MKSTAKLWALWFLLVFGLFNFYGPDPEAYRRPDDPPGLSTTDLVARMTKPQLLLSLLRDEADTRRYFAYASAILGRPAPNYFIRSAQEWSEVETQAPPRRAGMTEAGRFYRPWRDFSVEYPPGMMAFILPPALLTEDFSTFHFLFGLEMEVLLTLAVFFGVKTADRLQVGGGERALAWSLASTAALGIVAVRRYDACVALATSAALFGLASRRPVLAGAAWAGGVIAKGAPIVLAPFALFWHGFRRDWSGLAKSLAAAAFCLGLSGALYLAIAGPNYADAFAYHARRPLQFESFYGGVLIFLRYFDPSLATTAYSFGSDNIVSTYEPLLRRIASLAPPIAMLGVFFWAFWRMKRAKTEADRFAVLLVGAAACFVAFASLGKVFSPQYLVWLIPLGALASLRAGERARLWMIVAFALAQIEYPFLYSSLSDASDPQFGLLIVLRNFALWGWIFLLLRAPDHGEESHFLFAEKNSKSAGTNLGQCHSAERRRLGIP